MDRVNPLNELPVIDPGAPLLELIAGDRGAILSAPHAEPHFRGDYWKGRDSG